MSHCLNQAISCVHRNAFFCPTLPAVYTVTVLEDTPKGTVVLRPVSNDRDTSANQELSFAITSGNDQVSKRCFSWIS